MIDRLRFFDVMAWVRVPRLPRRENEQQAAVVVVRGEDVCYRRLWPVSLRVDHDRLVENPNAPLKSRGDVVAPAFELEAEDVAGRTADHVQITEPGELARAATGADEPPLLIAEEEGSVRRRVVVVEQLEDEAEATLLATPRATLESGRAVLGDAAVATARADEVRHEAEISDAGRSGSPLDTALKTVLRRRWAARARCARTQPAWRRVRGPCA